MPGLGQTVTYTLTAADARIITDRRSRAELAAAEPPHVIGPGGAPVAQGDRCAAIIVLVRNAIEPEASVALQVVLNGTDTHWVELAYEGTGPGTWCWPDV